MNSALLTKYLLFFIDPIVNNTLFMILKQKNGMIIWWGKEI